MKDHISHFNYLYSKTNETVGGNNNFLFEVFVSPEMDPKRTKQAHRAGLTFCEIVILCCCAGCTGECTELSIED